MNAGKSKVMVGSSGGKMIVNSGKWPCGVYGERSARCTVRCDGTIHEADLAACLVVEAPNDTVYKRWSCHNRFCKFCLWQISQIQARLFKVLGPGLVSTSPAFVSSSASHPAGPHDRDAQKR